MIFVVAFFNQQLTFAAVYYTGWHMDSVLLMAPSLIFVVSVSGGVHLTNYYRDAVREQGLAGAPLQALRWGWVPCLLSAATTSLGVISLIASHLVPIQKFGMYASVMVMVGTGTLFLLLPSLFEQWPSRKWAARLTTDLDEESSVDRIWEVLSGGRHARLCAHRRRGRHRLHRGVLGVTKTRCTARVHDMFAADARIVRDYNWLEEQHRPAGADRGRCQASPAAVVGQVVRDADARPAAVVEEGRNGGPGRGRRRSRHVGARRLRRRCPRARSLGSGGPTGPRQGDGSVDHRAFAGLCPGGLLKRCPTRWNHRQAVPDLGGRRALVAGLGPRRGQPRPGLSTRTE